MRKIICIIFILLSLGLLAKEKNLYDLKNLSFQVEEQTFIDNRKREQVYDIVIKFPDKMKKTMISPEINRGEIYLYNQGEKIVYLPFFKQTERSEISPEENRVLEFIKTLMEMEKNDKSFREIYYKNLKQQIELSSGEKIKIEKRIKAQGYLFPETIEIFSGEIRVAILKLSNFKSDVQIREDEFVIKNENSK